ncbi:MAG TPA: InlB B-repeat-containing protein, partial [Spirochaetota bacterium]
MKKLAALLAIIASVMQFSCNGNAIGDAQNFTPNKAPVITGYTIKNSVTGNNIDARNVILGMTVKVVVAASDPENQELTYTCSSSNGAISGQKTTATGCEFIFVVTSVAAGNSVTLNVSIKDTKNASTSEIIDIGSGKSGPVLTINTPSSGSIMATGSSAFSFSSTSDGWYQVLESGTNIDDPASVMTTSTKYTAGKNQTITVAGPSYTGTIDANSVKVSAGDGSKKIWVLFRDNNNYYTTGSSSVIIDGTAPSITTTPVSGAANISTHPVMALKFSEDIDQTTLPSALSIPGGSVTYQNYDSVTFTAMYNVSGLSQNMTYTATVNAKDLVGNVTAKSFSFTTTSSALVVTYFPNGADGGSAPASQGSPANSSVTVSGQGSLTRTGYTFAGWALNSAGTGTVYAASSSLSTGTVDINLYAKWTINQYQVTYDGNTSTGGTPPALQTANYNSTVIVANQNTLVKTLYVPAESFTVNYIFSGWKDSDGVSRVAGSSFTLTKNITLYAQ